MNTPEEIELNKIRWHTTVYFDVLTEPPKNLQEFQLRLERERIETGIVIQLIINGEL